jgi:thymidylate synthase
MHVIFARNVAEALPLGVDYVMQYGSNEPSRAGRVFVAPTPVTTVYHKPNERVLFSATRDANPFFHLAEAMWMLAGRNDSAYLDQFVKTFGARFAEPTGVVHGAYGYRWRNQFSMDQLKTVIRMLQHEPSTRQAVISMWDPNDDLDRPELKDRPCNTHIYLRIRDRHLDMTVCCRSNDILWGAYGANAVHFSILQEYLAAMIGVELGTYYQVSNNFHVYVDELERHPGSMADARHYPTVPLVDDPKSFDDELRMLMEGWKPTRNLFLSETVYWMLEAYLVRHVARDVKECLEQVKAQDWRVAAQEWVARRSKL